RRAPMAARSKADALGGVAHVRHTFEVLTLESRDIDQQLFRCWTARELRDSRLAGYGIGHGSTRWCRSRRLRRSPALILRWTAFGFRAATLKKVLGSIERRVLRTQLRQRVGFHRIDQLVCRRQRGFDRERRAGGDLARDRNARLEC